MDSNIANFEEELIAEWFNNMESTKWQYKEPILDSETTAVLRNACRKLGQDTHVFVNSVEILEDFIRRTDSIGRKIDDPILTAAACITISSKYTGDLDMKLKYIKDLLYKASGETYSLRDIVLKEIQILKTLDNSLALENIVDDLKTLAAKFECETKIKASIIPLCLDILELMYLLRKDWFFEFKEIYSVNEEALFTFEKLMCSRLFIPSAIIVYALKQTAYKDSLNIHMIVEQFADLCKVHTDHLKGLVRKMKQVFQHNS